MQTNQFLHCRPCPLRQHLSPAWQFCRSFARNSRYLRLGKPCLEVAALSTAPWEGAMPNLSVLSRDVTSNSGLPTGSAYPTRDEDDNILTTEFGLCIYKNHQVITMQVRQSQENSQHLDI